LQPEKLLLDFYQRTTCVDVVCRQTPAEGVQTWQDAVCCLRL